MTHESERIPLGADRPGTQRSLLVHRYGDPEARSKAYLQASLHADEMPALLVAHDLARLLDEAEARGEIAGQIVLVPYANPIGLDQIVNREYIRPLRAGRRRQLQPQLARHLRAAVRPGRRMG